MTPRRFGRSVSGSTVPRRRARRRTRARVTAARSRVAISEAPAASAILGRARIAVSQVVVEMRDPHPKTWDNLYGGAGAQGTLLLAFKNPELKPLTGKTLADVAKIWKESPEDAAIDRPRQPVHQSLGFHRLRFAHQRVTSALVESSS